MKTADSNLFFLGIASFILAAVGLFLAFWINKRELKTSFFLGLEFWQKAALGLAVAYQIYFSLCMSNILSGFEFYNAAVPRISLSGTSAWVFVGFSVANLVFKELRLILGSFLLFGILLAGYRDLSTPLIHKEVFLFYSSFVFVGIYSLFCALPKGMSETFFGYTMCAFSVFFLLDASQMTRKFQIFMGVRASSDILVFLSLLVILGWVAYILKIFKNSMIVILFIPTLLLATSYSMGPVALICILGLFLSAFLGHVKR